MGVPAHPIAGLQFVGHRPPPLPSNAQVAGAGDRKPSPCSKDGMAGEFSTTSYSDALVILGAAGIVIPAFARIRISPIIGFIMIGLLVGPAGLGSLAGEQPWLNYVTISNPHAIEPFAELG